MHQQNHTIALRNLIVFAMILFGLPAQAQNCVGNVTAQKLDQLISQSKKKAFEDQRLSYLKSEASNHCFTTSQVAKLIETFDHEHTKIAFAKYVYRYTADQEQFNELKKCFEFELSKDDLADFINRK